MSNGNCDVVADTPLVASEGGCPCGCNEEAVSQSSSSALHLISRGSVVLESRFAKRGRLGELWDTLKLPVRGLLHLFWA
jgi:hypothetical protein